jgi:hypothetical protein
LVSRLKKEVPPQLIVLVLVSGDIIFLFARSGEDGPAGRQIDFVSGRHRVSRPMLTEHPGAHLAVDPSSRFMAVACFENLFAIYSLHSREELQNQYKTTDKIDPVKEERYIRIEGVIHKMEFLHPSANDQDHIILLLLVVSGGRTRMLVYDWDVTQDIRSIKSHGQKGHLLNEGNRMPQLLIPLKVKSSFLLISKSSITVFSDILTGQPQYLHCPVSVDPPSQLHQGLSEPLWSSWYRAPRWTQSLNTQDHVYIAREDGVIRFLEIDEDGVSGNMNVGNLHCNVGTAFACLEHYMEAESQYNDPTKMGDVLIAGGETCPGGMYMVRLALLSVSQCLLTFTDSSSNPCSLNGECGELVAYD